MTTALCADAAITPMKSCRGLSNTVLVVAGEAIWYICSIRQSPTFAWIILDAQTVIGPEIGKTRTRLPKVGQNTLQMLKNAIQWLVEIAEGQELRTGI
jgi:hypothetical protein